jgi:hypothetical protein
VKRLLRILSALAVFFTSSVFLLGVNYAARHFTNQMPKYGLVMALFNCIGLLSISGIYFILGLSKA